MWPIVCMQPECSSIRDMRRHMRAGHRSQSLECRKPRQRLLFLHKLSSCYALALGETVCMIDHGADSQPRAILNQHVPVMHRMTELFLLFLDRRASGAYRWCVACRPSSCRHCARRSVAAHRPSCPSHGSSCDSAMPVSAYGRLSNAVWTASPEGKRPTEGD